MLSTPYMASFMAHVIPGLVIASLGLFWSFFFSIVMSGLDITPLGDSRHQVKMVAFL